MLTPKTFYLDTMGCQMNVLDSELVSGMLCSCGYEAVRDIQSADIVLVNTCSVRDHAEEKAYSRLGQLKSIKSRRPRLIVGVIGCMAQRDPKGILAKADHVDLLCGPSQLDHIPAMLDEVAAGRSPVISVSSEQSRLLDPARRSLEALDSLEELDRSRIPLPGQSVLQRYVRVQRGCDQFCTFCVVPFTRGPERSRDPRRIVEEAKILADRGAKEITLLGQTVNSYSYLEMGRRTGLADLLARINDVSGVERIRFVTSYPGDFSDNLFYAMCDLPKVCEYLHIPAQSGSNEVLKRMRRDYSVESYIDLMHRAREIVPEIQLAGDFIVGFCGEIEDDFERTVALVETVRYKNIFCFKYSPRPGTAADRHQADDVPTAVKRRRNSQLLKVQEQIAARENQRMIGRSVEVLVEGYSKAAVKAQQAEQSRGHEVGWRRSDQLVGRTRGDHIVVFNGDRSLIGRLIGVRVVSATALTLHAVPDAAIEHGTTAASTPQR